MAECFVAKASSSRNGGPAGSVVDGRGKLTFSLEDRVFCQGGALLTPDSKTIGVHGRRAGLRGLLINKVRGDINRGGQDLSRPDLRGRDPPSPSVGTATNTTGKTGEIASATAGLKLAPSSDLVRRGGTTFSWSPDFRDLEFAG